MTVMLKKSTTKTFFRGETEMHKPNLLDIINLSNNIKYIIKFFKEIIRYFRGEKILSQFKVRVVFF